MSDIVTRAEKALEGVTGGPWDAAEAFDASFVCAGEGTVADSWIVRLDNRPGRVKDRVNTRFIAAARTLVPELVAELRAARAEVELQHSLFTQEAAATNLRVADARQAGFVEGLKRK